MNVLKLIALLLDYPSAELFQNRAELLAELDSVQRLRPAALDRLKNSARALLDGELLDAQEAYIDLFDRGRATSLLLFEHVHGESRDRGQAMVDLMSVYQREGYAIDCHELPDYLPLFLEFLATRPDEEAVNWLNEVAHILALLAERLNKRESPYAGLFDVLLDFADAEVERAPIRATVAGESRDDTPEAIDKIWEEEAVRFGGDALNGGCPSQRPAPSATATAGNIPVQLVHDMTLARDAMPVTPPAHG